MLRVLMVLEDYGELMFLQTVLKKIGFDVDAIQNPRSFPDAVLRMNPDLLVMTAFGKRVNGHEMNKNLRRARGVPRAILLRNPGMVHEQDDLVSGWLDSPVAATDLLNMIGEVCGLNKQVLQDKFQRLAAKGDLSAKGERDLGSGDDPDEPVLQKRVKAAGNFSENDEPTLERGTAPANPSGDLKASTIPSEERSERYKKFLQEQPPQQAGFTVKDVQEKVRELRKLENPEDLADLERERKLFVEHLFKKKA